MRTALLWLVVVLLGGAAACPVAAQGPTPGGPYPIHLPVVLKQGSAAQPPPGGGRVQPGDLVYLGAFRLPGGDEPPRTFAYGGNAMTFNPAGDPGGAADGHPGSLFVMGHDRQAWGALPDGNQVAEVSIPAPAAAADPAGLPHATFLQEFAEVAAGHFGEMDEVPKVGMQYLDHPATGPRLHLSWGRHLQQPEDGLASHAWANPDLAAPDLQGTWFIGEQNPNSTNGYLFEIPAAWAEAYTGERPLATGRVHSGGLGGMGPALFAYRPWIDAAGTPAPDGAHLDEVVLLLYENAYNTDQFVRTMAGYQHADEWEGGAWITTPGGKAAVVFAGTKSTGAKHWYGYLHPDGPALPCVDAEVTDFVTCRLADGSPCPAEDMGGCCQAGVDCITNRGWWSSRYDAQLIFYDPADLARVAAGTLAPWEPQPYAALDVDEHLVLDPPVGDEIVLGWGVQRRMRLGDVAYDRESGLLYVLELYADGARPVVHTWRIE